MLKIRLSACPHSHDELCGVLNNESSCPYGSELEGCFYDPEAHHWQDKRSLMLKTGVDLDKPKGDMSIEEIAKTQIGLADAFLNGEIGDREYRSFCLALGFTATKMSQKKVQAMINSAQMIDITERLQMADVEQFTCKKKENEEETDA